MKKVEKNIEETGIKKNEEINKQVDKLRNREKFLSRNVESLKKELEEKTNKLVDGDEFLKW